MKPGLFIDGFAGGGGTSTGVAQARGREVDIAINHDPCAMAIHKANHPGTEHHCEDMRAVWPLHVTRMRPVDGAWFSPDCKEHSKAKGGPVKDRNIRALAWEVLVWLEQAEPIVAYLENVEEFQMWGPLDDSGHIIKERRGEEFKRWLRAIRRLGYRVAHRELRACDYGAPTSRKRLYVIMRRDGQPIVWPRPTHGRPDSPGVRSGRLKPYRMVAGCIDWSIPCPSIFDRDRALKDATHRRIAHGVVRFVISAKRPFIVGTAFTSTRASRIFDPQDPLRTSTTQAEYGVVDAAIVPVTHGGALRAHSVAEPLRTITTANGGEFALAQATLVTAHMEKFNADSRPRPVDEPLHTVLAGSARHGLVTAHLERAFGGSVGAPIDEPAPTIMPGGGGKTAAVTAFLSSFYTSNTNGGRGDPLQPLKTVLGGANHHAVVAAHIEQANTGMVGHDARKPLSTIVGKGCTQRIVETTLVEEGALPPELMAKAVRVAAFLVKYYGSGGDSEHAQSQRADRPLDTITTKARFAVVTVTIDAVTYVIVDIGLRMLTPRELARAQGFPDSYILDPIVPQMERGRIVHKRLSKAKQIRAIGNSVCPDVARALVTANDPWLASARLAVAA